MRIDVDLDADASYITVSKNAVARTLDLNDSVAIDVDDSGALIGIEILGDGAWTVADIEAKCTLAEETRRQLVMLTGHTLARATSTPLQMA